MNLITLKNSLVHVDQPWFCPPCDDTMGLLLWVAFAITLGSRFPRTRRRAPAQRAPKKKRPI